MWGGSLIASAVTNVIGENRRDSWGTRVRGWAERDGEAGWEGDLYPKDADCVGRGQAALEATRDALAETAVDWVQGW